MNCENLHEPTQFPQPGLMESEGAESVHYPQNWFAVYTRSHREKSVMHHSIDRGIENFLPLYKAVHCWTENRKAALDLPLIPNYLFVHIDPRERVRTLEVPAVVS